MSAGLDWYRGKSVVVTGASGYVASALLPRLAGVSARVTRLSRKALPPRAGWTDLCGEYDDAALWRRALPGADAVFHLAAQTSVYAAAADPDADFRANVAPVRALLEACRREGTRPFIVLAGTATEAGMPAKLPVDESVPDEPITVYDLHKLLAETLLEGYARQGLARGTTLRLANVFGPGPRSSSSDRGILNATIAKALRGETLTVYGDGAPVRDHLFVADLAEAFLAAGRGGDLLNGRHFVLGSGRGTSLADGFRLVAARVAARTGRKVETVSVPPPAGLSPIEGRSFIADAGAFRRATGWAPRTTLEEGIDLTIGFALERSRSAETARG